MMKHRFSLHLVVVLVGAATALPIAAAAAPTPEEQALATVLFREARTLLESSDAADVAKACPKLEESHRLSPAGGTILNLAVCHEKIGKSASAVAEFREARLFAERDQRPDRLELANEHIALLEPKLSKIVIHVAAGSATEDLAVMIDQRPIRRPAWDTQIPVDPGDHVIEAIAPGKTRWHESINLPADGSIVNVAVPELENEEPAHSPGSPPAIAFAPARSTTDDGNKKKAQKISKTRTIALYVASGIGVAGVGVGSFFGLRALSKHNDGADACTTSTTCSPSLAELNDSAKQSADIATIAFSTGAIALGVAAYLWFSNQN